MNKKLKDCFIFGEDICESKICEGEEKAFVVWDYKPEANHIKESYYEIPFLWRI